MKAQSDLTGDRERRAEMTRPRKRGATNWMSGIDAMNNSADRIFDSSSLSYGLSGALADFPSIGKSYIIDTEVKHRPAAQQWVVCTP